MFASDQPGCSGVAARLPKKPGTQKLTPPSSANAQLEKPMMAGVKTHAATPSLRRRADFDRLLCAAASAMLTVISCLVRCVASEYNSATAYPKAIGAHHVKIQRG
jgi:hypothetical protein